MLFCRLQEMLYTATSRSLRACTTPHRIEVRILLGHPCLLHAESLSFTSERQLPVFLEDQKRAYTFKSSAPIMVLTAAASVAQASAGEAPPVAHSSV